MKKFTLALTMAIGCASAIGQVSTEHHFHKHAPENPSPCGASEAQIRLFEENPEFEAEFEAEQVEFQLAYEEFLTSWSPDDRSTYIVPMVVHVVHLGGEENISDEQIYNAIEVLNEDFNMENSDLALTIPEFADIAGNCDIEFRLATKDNSGQCHRGITRTYSSTTYDTGLGGGSHPIIEAVRDEHGNWPQNKYMNVFVCIDPNGAAGYTFNPGGWYPAGGMYGSIMMRHDYMGAIGTSSNGRKHTLAHEVGHWLNLSHPWGGTNNPGLASNCGTDDGVLDTPNTIGWDNCSDVYGATCGSLDNVQNIMDYSYCSTMFTEGQAARVQASLLGGTAQRFRLSLTSNLAATGTDGPGELCEANFSSNVRTVCAGSSVEFSDLSFHTVVDRDWDFEGGTPSSSTAENPTITYNTPGVYSVTLNVSDGGGSESLTQDAYIVVLPETGIGLPYSEGFESLSELPDNDRFVLENEDGEETWELTTDAASSGSTSIYIDNHGLENGSRDALVSGTIDLSGVDEDDDIVFNFKYAYKKRSADNDEWIRFYISNDCGESWALRKNIHGDDLSEEVQGSAYTPESDLVWYQVDITNIFPDYYVSNFRYRIEFQNDEGNNIYIDDINLYPASTASLADNKKEDFGLTIYPNPMGDNGTIELNAIQGETYEISIYSALGQKMTTIYQGELAEGQNIIPWSAENLAKGMYILHVATGESVQTVKLVKE